MLQVVTKCHIILRAWFHMVSGRQFDHTDPHHGTLVIMYQTTWRNITAGSHLHTLYRENLKFHSDVASLLGLRQVEALLLNADT
jgi:hypothetical protein